MTIQEEEKSLFPIITIEITIRKGFIVGFYQNDVRI